MARRRDAPELLAGPTELDAVIERMAVEIDALHPDGVHVVGVLKGAVCLVADLTRRLTVPVTIDFLAVRPYTPGSGRVRLLKDLDHDIAGRNVLLVEDLVDTGLTLDYLRRELLGRQPATLRVAALADKPARRIVPVHLDVLGLTVPDKFVVGYGLDFAGRYRNLHGLWGVDAEVLAAEPDAYLLDLYGR